MIAKYRDHPSESSLKEGNDVHFDEFLRFIADSHRRKYYKKLNVHWRPFSRLCIPCDVNYDFIGHLETLQPDSDFVLNEIAPDLAGSPEFRFPTATTGPSSLRYRQATETRIRNYFRNISAAVFGRLLRIYKLDFDLFGYNPLLYE